LRVTLDPDGFGSYRSSPSITMPSAGSSSRTFSNLGTGPPVRSAIHRANAAAVPRVVLLGDAVLAHVAVEVIQAGHVGQGSPRESLRPAPRLEVADKSAGFF
jgi:hypothetical protein